jgi:hypothetical protein
MAMDGSCNGCHTVDGFVQLYQSISRFHCHYVLLVCTKGVSREGHVKEMTVNEAAVDE